MKIVNTLVLATFAILATGTLADKEYKPPRQAKNANIKPKKQIKTVVNFGNGGAKIDLCPSGECTKGQLIRLLMSRLVELGPNGQLVNNAAQNFASLSTNWSAMQDMVVNGVMTTSTSFVTSIPVGPGGTSGTAQFNLTASIYAGNGTTMNGNQTIPVPAGGLKFTVTISNWPFKSPANRLQFGVILKARGKDGKDRPTPEKKPKKHANGTRIKIDRVDMGEGMFMDAPEEAVIDGVQASINATVDASFDKVEYQWVFPYFNRTLYYDPVVGSEDPSAEPDYPMDTEMDTPTTNKRENAVESWKVMSGLVAASAMMIATAML